ARGPRGRRPACARPRGAPQGRLPRAAPARARAGARRAGPRRGRRRARRRPRLRDGVLERGIRRVAGGGRRRAMNNAGRAADNPALSRLSWRADVRERHGRVDEKLETPNAEWTYTVTPDDLPLHCPLPQMYLWNSHPKVYLPIE